MTRRPLVIGAALAGLALVVVVTVVLTGAEPRGGAAPTASTSATVPATTPAPTTAASTTPAPTAPVPSAHRVFPVLGEPVSYGQTHHGYPATDIFAPCGATYIAPYSGTVHEVNLVDRFDPARNRGPTRGGLSVAILGDDGVRYYGSHFSAVEDTIRPGARVAAGQLVATVGMTGDAGACHVHFGLSPVCSDGDWFVRRGTIWPWPYLDSWRSGGDDEPRAEIEQWRLDNGCPDRPLVEP